MSKCYDAMSKCSGAISICCGAISNCSAEMSNCSVTIITCSTETCSFHPKVSTCTGAMSKFHSTLPSKIRNNVSTNLDCLFSLIKWVEY